MPTDREQVRAELESLGIPAKTAARIADADADGPTPQLVRHSLLDACWRNVVDAGGAWIDQYEGSYPAGPRLRALLDAGVDRAALSALVRAMQFELLAAVTMLLDEGRTRRTSARWRLFEVDDDGRPGRAVHALHESLTASDPSGEADGWM